MTKAVKQHLIDPEICIRCHACENACSINAISHNDDNVVVDPDICTYCMDCIAPCPTGSIDNWRIVTAPYSVDEQLGWMELPEQAEMAETGEAQDDHITALLKTAHAGAGGRVPPPASAGAPAVNLFTTKNPLRAKVQGNYRLTATHDTADVRHVILDLGAADFPWLEGQSVAITAPGVGANGRPHPPRLYSISSPRDGERAGFNNLSLTIKRETNGLCSNYICDLALGDTVNLSGPFGGSFLIPDDPNARLLMICTGTGSAPFRAFTMHRQRQRQMAGGDGGLTLYFGARTADSLPYFGPLNKIPNDFLEKHFALSRVKGQPKVYVQDLMRENATRLGAALLDRNTHVYICGLKAMESGVQTAFSEIAKKTGANWNDIQDTMRSQGRYHVETY